MCGHGADCSNVFIVFFLFSNFVIKQSVKLGPLTLILCVCATAEKNCKIAK